MLHKNYFSILAFLGLLLAKKQPQLTKNEENWQNLNRLVKFSEIWYIDASQQKKIQQKNYFSILSIVWSLLAEKQPQLTKNKEKLQNLNRLVKFSENWYGDTPQQKKRYKKTFFRCRHLLAKKTAKN